MWLALGGGFLSLFLIGGCFAAFEPETSTTSASSLADHAANGESSIPAEQGRFLAAVAEGQQVSEDANELQVVEARVARGEAMCDVLGPDLAVTDWVGTIEELATSVGGDGGVLTVEIASDVSAGTMNNGFSDIGEDTLIDPESDVWDQIIDLEVGDEVRFSGAFNSDRDDCVRETSLMDVNGMLTPDFIFKFSDVRPVS